MVQPATQREPRRWWVALALGVVAVVCSGAALLAQTADGRGSADAGDVPVERVLGPQPAGAARMGPAGSVGPAAGLPPPPPVWLSLPRLEVDAPVRPVSVGEDGLLAVPDNPRQLGWWSASGRPGMPSASVVINGHVDSASFGLGALSRLHEARPGDRVLLTNAAEVSTRYTVVARRSYAKASLPVAEVFARNVGPRLVLITCGGRFDQATRHYADNVVIYAVPG